MEQEKSFSCGETGVFLENPVSSYFSSTGHNWTTQKLTLYTGPLCPYWLGLKKKPGFWLRNPVSINEFTSMPA
jgi:hypothetical protein